jgi:hypothetical protein
MRGPPSSGKGWGVEIWLAIERQARKPKVTYPPVRAIFFLGHCFREGIETRRIMEQEVRIYNAPKTVIGCFRIMWAGRTGLGDAMKDGENADSLSAISLRCQSITRASPSSRLFHQNTTFHQIVDISQGRILRAFGELGPFGRSQLTFKIVE